MKATGIIVLILVIFAAAVLAEVWRELHCFKITRYRIRTSKIKGDAGKVRIAFLSDLHNHVYGKENEELLGDQGSKAGSDPGRRRYAGRESRKETWTPASGFDEKTSTDRTGLVL